MLDRRLVVVTGKGGVGKSTVAAAVALAAAGCGQRVLLVELAGRADVPRLLEAPGAPRIGVVGALTPGVDHVTIDPPHALREYLGRELSRPAAALLLAGGAFTGLAEATPGLAELVTIGKVWSDADPAASRGTPDHDLVILDAPASGHVVALLKAPATFAAATHTGPVAAQAGQVAAFLADPARTAVLAVATPEALAVAETLELRGRLIAALGVDLTGVVVDRVLPDRFSAAEERVLEAAAPSPAIRAGRFAAHAARHQRAELARLRAGLGGLPITQLPFLFEPALGRASVQRLALEPGLSGALASAAGDG